MFSTYDLKTFSTRLKEIHKGSGYTQENVVTATGLSAETLRKLENGLVIPRYDTIEILSSFYKIDLHSILNHYKSSRDILQFYELIDYYIVDFNKISIVETIESFNNYVNQSELHLIEKKEIEQLNLLFKGLYLSYSTDESPEIVSEIISIYIEAIKACTPNFTINTWKQFKYTHIELRILFALASLYGLIRECRLSNDLLFHIMESADYSPTSKHVEKLLISKAYSLIAYNYHRLDEHEKALEFAETGIAYCNSVSIMSNLPLLLGRKGIAMHFLGQTKYEEYLDLSVALLCIQGNHALAETYNKIYQKYKKLSE